MEKGVQTPKAAMVGTCTLVEIVEAQLTKAQAQNISRFVLSLENGSK